MKKGKRNHKKRHGVNRERALQARRKHARMMRERAAYRVRQLRWRAINRLYWSGSVPDLDTAARVVDGLRTRRAA
jgi:hypothetical protein